MCWHKEHIDRIEETPLAVLANQAAVRSRASLRLGPWWTGMEFYRVVCFLPPCLPSDLTSRLRMEGEWLVVVTDQPEQNRLPCAQV